MRYTSKVDVGTGMRVAIAQMAAEELGVDTPSGDCRRRRYRGGARTRAVRVQHRPHARGHGGSAGGGHCPSCAARARRRPAEAAGRRPHDRCRRSTTRGRGRGVGIGTLVGGRRLALPVDAKATLAQPLRYTRVGQSPLRPDVPAKCTGRYQYIQDFTVPGMLHARAIRPPAIGATLVSVDESSVAHLPGVRVVRLESFLAVVSSDEWAAVRGARELKAVWSEWRGLPGHDNLERYLRDGRRRSRDQAIVNRGPSGPVGESDPSGAALEAALASSSTRMAASYFWPCQSHASLAPSCAVADVRGDAVTVWTSSQVTYGLRATIARVFGLVPEKMRVVFVEGSGVCTGPTVPIMPQPMPCFCRRRSDSPCGCSGRVRMSTPGIRRARRSCSIYERVSTRLDGWWHGIPKCGFPPTAAERGSCSPPSQRAFPRTTA